MYDSLIEPELDRLVPPRSEAYQVPTYKDIMQKNLALLHLAEIHMRDHHIPVTPLPLSPPRDCISSFAVCLAAHNQLTVLTQI